LPAAINIGVVTNGELAKALKKLAPTDELKPTDKTSGGLNLTMLS
jgi:hypothetical protein